MPGLSVDKLTLRLRTLSFLYEVLAKFAHPKGHLQFLPVDSEVVCAQNHETGLGRVGVGDEKGLGFVIELSYGEGLDFAILSKELFSLQDSGVQERLGHSLDSNHVSFYYSEVI